MARPVWIAAVPGSIAADYCRTAYRFRLDPSIRSGNQGFRLARVLGKRSRRGRKGQRAGSAGRNGGRQAQPPPFDRSDERADKQGLEEIGIGGPGGTPLAALDGNCHGNSGNSGRKPSVSPHSDHPEGWPVALALASVSSRDHGALNANQAISSPARESWRRTGNDRAPQRLVCARVLALTETQRHGEKFRDWNKKIALRHACPRQSNRPEISTGISLLRIERRQDALRRQLRSSPCLL
jgi:hypothetical protein